jgi:hypothetical protein
MTALINKKYLLIATRIFFALLAFSAVVTEIATLIERGNFIPANFFSYFTVVANLLAVIILLISALSVVVANGQSQRIAMLRGSSTLNMILVGIVFSLLLAGLDVELTAVPWDNTVLHYIMPIFVALDWFLELPNVRIAFRRALVWMTFPLVYVTYILIRGHFANWYPYPFLSPAERGYFGVAITSLLIAFVGTGLIWVLVSFRWRSSVRKAKN